MECLDQYMGSYVQSGFSVAIHSGQDFLLPKVDEVETIGELRPICILSLLWRVTTRIIARRALQQFLEVLPAACQGALPKQGARDVWFQVQYAVEQALDQGQQLLGGAIDTVKCFNCISRRVGARLATELGFDPDFVDAWFSFYRDMRRIVVFQGSFSMPQSAECGGHAEHRCGVGLRGSANRPGATFYVLRQH